MPSKLDFEPCSLRYDVALAWGCVAYVVQILGRFSAVFGVMDTSTPGRFGKVVTVSCCLAGCMGVKIAVYGQICNCVNSGLFGGRFAVLLRHMVNLCGTTTYFPANVLLSFKQALNVSKWRVIRLEQGFHRLKQRFLCFNV